MEKNDLGFQIFKTRDNHNGAIIVPKELAEQFFLGVAIKRELAEHEAKFSNRKICKMLRFKEERNWRKYVIKE